MTKMAESTRGFWGWAILLESGAVMPSCMHNQFAIFPTKKQAEKRLKYWITDQPAKVQRVFVEAV